MCEGNLYLSSRLIEWRRNSLNRMYEAWFNILTCIFRLYRLREGRNIHSLWDSGCQSVDSVFQTCFKEQEETQFGCCIQNVQSFGNVKRANVEVAERTVHDLVLENMALKAVQRVVFYIKPLKQRVAL